MCVFRDGQETRYEVRLECGRLPLDTCFLPRSYTEMTLMYSPQSCWSRLQHVWRELPNHSELFVLDEEEYE